MDAIRSLCVLDQVRGIGTVIVVHHTGPHLSPSPYPTPSSTSKHKTKPNPTDCGLTHTTDAFIRKGLKERAPTHTDEIDDMGFGEIKEYVLPLVPHPLPPSYKKPY